MQYNFSGLLTEIKKIEEFLGREYSQLNIGRASLAILDSIQVDSYGARVPLKNIASISIEDPKTLRVAPWDKSQIKEIEKAVVSANLGLGVGADDAGVRVVFPQLTGETRAKLVKVLSAKLEESRISVRREREGIWEDVQTKEKEGKMTEDEKFRAKDELQKIVDEANRNLEELFKRKEKEVMS